MWSICGVPPHIIPTLLSYFRFSLKTHKPYIFLPPTMSHSCLSPLSSFRVAVPLHYALMWMALFSVGLELGVLGPLLAVLCKIVFRSEALELLKYMVFSFLAYRRIVCNRCSCFL